MAEENHEKPSVRIVDVPADIRTEYLLNRSLGLYL
jgi:hypothetical protein